MSRTLAVLLMLVPLALSYTTESESGPAGPNDSGTPRDEVPKPHSILQLFEEKELYTKKTVARLVKALTNLFDLLPRKVSTPLLLDLRALMKETDPGMRTSRQKRLWMKIWNNVGKGDVPDAVFRHFSLVMSENYHRQLFNFHCKNFYNLEADMLDIELRYVGMCFYQAGLQNPRSLRDLSRFSYITYSHRVAGGEVNSSRFAIGLVDGADKVKPVALEVIRERGIPFDEAVIDGENVKFGGLGWDMIEGHFKVYLRVVRVQELELPCTETFCVTSRPRGSGIVSWTYDLRSEGGPVLFEEKIYDMGDGRRPRAEEDEELDDDTTTTNMITSRRGVVPQIDVHSQKSRRRWYNLVNDRGKAIIDKCTAAGYDLDTVAATDSNHYTLYFPV